MDAWLPTSLPDDVEALKAALRGRARQADFGRGRRGRPPRPQLSADQALIAHLKLQIAKLKRQLYRAALGTHGAAARSDGTATRRAGGHRHRGRDRRRDGPPPRPRRSRPSHASVPRASRSPSICRASGWSSRRRRAAPAAAARACRKLGEDVTETLEVDPAPVEGDPARAREVHVPGLRDASARRRRRSMSSRAAGPAPACWR